MVVIDQCRVFHDMLYIDAHVNTASYFKNVGLSKVIVFTGDQYKESGDSAPTSNYIYMTTIQSSDSSPVKEVHLALHTTNMNEYFTKSNFQEDIFFVYIEVTGTPASDTPCGMDNSYIVGVAYDKALVYNKALLSLKELGDTCSIPTGLQELIMQTHALEFSIEASDWTNAIKYFELIKGDTVAVSNSRPCGCGK